MSLIGFRRNSMAGSVCSVTFHLDGLTTSAPNQVFNGMPYTATFSVLDNKTFLPSTVRVLMGGIEVTDNTFDFETNTIFIPNVTGNVEITAEAQTISSTLLDAYDILTYIGCIAKEASPGLRFTTISSTEKSRFYTSLNMKEGSSYLISEPSKMPSSSSDRPAIGAAEFSTYGWWIWARRISGGQPKFTRFVNKRMDIDINKGFCSVECKTVNTKNTLNMYVEGETFTGGNVTILGNTTSTSAGGVRGDVYSVMHWSDDVLTHNYIPVKRKSDKKVGMLDINGSNSFILKNSTNWIAPYIIITNTRTNCTATRLSTAETGFATYMVIGKEWQFKYTPNVDYTFRSDAFYDMKVSEDDELLHNWIAVERLSDNACGLYDIITGTYTNAPVYITPYVNITIEKSSCVNTMLSSNTGNLTHACIGKSWSSKFTPIGNCTFNSQDAIFQVMINNVDKTIDYATYDSTTDTWTVTLVPHWKDDISITATPDGILELAFIGNSWTGSSRVENAIALEIQSRTKGFYVIQNGSAVSYPLADGTVVKYDGVYYTTLSNIYLVPYSGLQDLEATWENNGYVLTNGVMSVVSDTDFRHCVINAHAGETYYFILFGAAGTTEIIKEVNGVYTSVADIGTTAGIYKKLVINEDCTLYVSHYLQSNNYTHPVVAIGT